jgi:hypothetical protein
MTWASQSVEIQSHDSFFSLCLKRESSTMVTPRLCLSVPICILDSSYKLDNSLLEKFQLLRQHIVPF